MTPAEGRAAVQQRGAMQGHSLSTMDADAIATALGHDPLLIALHDVREKPDPHSVIVRFIEACIKRTAVVNKTYTATDYRMALLALAQEMLSKRNIDPRWAHVLAWLGSSGDVLPALRALTTQGEVIRMAPHAGGDRLAFRHDRVRDSLLTTALAERLRDGMLDDDLLSDPFFAEMVGSILASDDTPASFLPDVVRANPLALFYGLARASHSVEKSTAIAEAIKTWLKSPEGQDQSYNHLRWQAQRVLSLIESPHILEIVTQFKEQGWDAWAARFRNGDLAGGFELGRRLDPGTGDPWRDRLMEHVKLRFGSGLIEAVVRYLRRTDIASDARLGALRIATHLADARLADAIAFSWEVDDNRLSHLDNYLVAAAYSCEANAARLLAPICDAWAALPSKAEKKNNPSAREELAAYGVRFTFQRHPPRAAIPYFIERARSKELNWPITYMLHDVDDPVSIEFIARERAAIARRLAGSGSFSPFLVSSADRWSRAGEDGGKPMSQASKDKLFSLWNSAESDNHLKEQAFRLWAATLRDGDLDILKQVDLTDKLWDKALYARLVRGDHSAIPFLEEKLRTKDPFYWWQAGRYIWSERLTAALDQSLGRRGAQVERSWKQKHSDADWMISEMVMRLPVGTAEALLLKHWDHLRYAPNFIHAALHTATKSLLAKVETTLAECPDPKEAMKYIDQHYGLKQKGRSVARRAQMEALVPFLDLMDEQTIDRFADVCNEQGWLDFRRKHLDPRLTDPRYAEFKDEENIFRSLDEFAAKDRIYNMDWWLNRFKRSGAGADEIIQWLGQWLAFRKSMQALRVVAEAVAQIGQRKDLIILSVNEIEPADEVRALLADTEFSVKRRTLH
jgi:hypothetical protein